MSATPKEQFAAVPVRAVCDDRLTASHWRLLAAIAWHDRLGRSNLGCFASTRTLAEEARVHYTNVARLAQDLQGSGYITTGRHPLNRRLRVYHLIYNEKKETVGEPTNNEPPDTAADMMFGELTNYGPGIVGDENPQAHDSKEEPPAKYIQLSCSDNIVKKEEGNSALASPRHLKSGSACAARKIAPNQDEDQKASEGLSTQQREAYWLAKMEREDEKRE